MSKNLQIQTLVNGSLEENAYIIYIEPAKGGILIDPGAEGERLSKQLDELGIEPQLIAATHGHFDHIGQVHYFQKKYGCRFVMHAGDQDLLEALPDNYAFYGMGDTQVPSVDQYLEDGQMIEAAGVSLQVLHTPGHSLGGLCFYHAQSKTLLSGDTLFKMSVGRSDFPGGDHQALIKSIKEKLLSLPEDTRVYPGHGPSTSIAEEKNGNPHLK